MLLRYPNSVYTAKFHEQTSAAVFGLCRDAVTHLQTSFISSWAGLSPLSALWSASIASCCNSASLTSSSYSFVSDFCSFCIVTLSFSISSTRSSSRATGSASGKAALKLSGLIRWGNYTLLLSLTLWSEFGGLAYGTSIASS